jgi:hypothetical protein
MNQTQIAKVTAAYSGFLDAGTSYAHVMQEAAKALGGTPCSTLLAALAAVHAAKYKCNFTWNKSGDAVFYNGEESTRETRNSPARMSWSRNVMVWFKADKAPPQKSHGRITREARTLGMDFLANFEGKDRAAQVRAAIALLNAIK